MGVAPAAKCTSLILVVCSVFLSTSFIEKKGVQETETESHSIFAQTNSVQADTVQGSESINAANVTIKEYSVPTGSRPHDVAPMYNLTNDGDWASSPVDATVWYTAQRLGELGKLDPITGETHHIPLGQGSAPHGVIVGPDGAPWITDGGLNAIVRVDPSTEEVEVYRLPQGAGYANLNTATFDHQGTLWFTGQSGIYGRLDPQVGQIDIFQAPDGPGPYGISTTPNGTIYYSSLAGSYVARIDLETGDSTVLLPPTAGQGARRVWPDSQGRIWVRMQVRWPSTIHQLRNGKNGGFQVRILCRMPYMLMKKMWFG